MVLLKDLRPEIKLHEIRSGAGPGDEAEPPGMTPYLWP